VPVFQIYVHITLINSPLVQKSVFSSGIVNTTKAINAFTSSLAGCTSLEMSSSTNLVFPMLSLLLHPVLLHLSRPLFSLLFRFLHLLHLQLNLLQPHLLFGATYMSVNLVFHARTKHVEIDFHFVQDRVADKSLVVQFVPSSDWIADALTKPLVSRRFPQLCFELNVQSPPLILREGINETLTQDSQSQLESCAAQSNLDSCEKNSIPI